MKKIILTTSLFIFVWTVALSRDTKLFNDGWSFKKGPFSTSASTLSSNIMGGKWQDVSIPHTWNAKDMQVAMANTTWLRNPQSRFYTGEALYKKTYTPDAALKDKRIFLRFEGVGSVAEIYVNNAFAGRHLGAYSAFAVEIGDLLKFGEGNEIVVKVDNQERPDVIPINNILFGVYGGIYRDISLIVTDKVNIAVTDYASSGIYISQTNVNKKSADVSVKIKMENKTGEIKETRLVTTIYESDGKTVKTKKETSVKLLPQARQFFTHDIKVGNPHLWQGLEDPYLYKIVTQVVLNGAVVDEVAQALGLRHFELKTGDGMYLNGKKVPMYGVCRHQDWWEKGSALTNAEHDTDLAIIREMGATTIRFAHYQQAERIYAKCDSIGFIVWAEIPFVNQVSTLETENAKQQLTELIRQNYNHPCIYVWGLHNEVYNPSEHTNSLTTTLNDLAKTEDPYRYTASVNGHRQVDHVVNHNADILGINHYFGWYSGKLSDFEPWLEKTAKDFPNHNVIYSEYGAEANIDQQREEVGESGDCCGFEKDYNESFATRFHETHWSVLSSHPYFTATYIWNTFDFATPLSSQGGVHSRNMKGLVTFDRKTKKDPFYWYKANWSKEPVLYLTQRRVVNRMSDTTSVSVYSNVGTPQLFVNGAEIKAFKPGATAVHYVFDQILLQEGDNVIEVKATKDGQIHEDKIIWNYSAKRKADGYKPTERTGEHVGL